MLLSLGVRSPSMHLHEMKLSAYLDESKLPPLPVMTNWAAAVDKHVNHNWGMDGNDVDGDCTCAGPAHNLMCVTANGGTLVTPSTAQVLKMYQASGWVPTNPASDQGWTLLAAANYMISTGLCGFKASGFVEVDPKNETHHKYAIWLMGGVNWGVNLPQSAMDAFQATNGAGVVWDFDPKADNTILGGHDVFAVDYLSDGNMRIVTWGSDGVIVTPAWRQQFLTEISATYYPVFVLKDGKAPNGVAWADIEADAHKIAA